MDAVPAKELPVEFFDLDVSEWDALVAGWGWPKFRAQQVRDWVYHKGVRDPAAMTSLSKADRETLAAKVRFGSAEVLAHQVSEDGTQKLLIGWPNGAQAETVMIPDGNRRTACVSSQVGCPVGCTFCASGLEGVKGNLTSGQILEQVILLNEKLAAGGWQPVAEDPDGTENAALAASRQSLAASPAARPRSGFTNRDGSHVRPETKPAQGPPKITNIVFMGMGEPMANYANVFKAVHNLHDSKCLNIGARRITVSTVGVPKKIRDMAHESLPLGLAISLHAPNEPLRKTLIPWAEHFSMDEILDAVRYYFDQTGREVTFEYILLAGVNDQPEHAKQLLKVSRGMRVNVNLIRYNEVPMLPHKRPTSDAVMTFQKILLDGGLNTHVRKSRGRDIAAACGQLKRQEKQKNERLTVLGA